MIKLNHIKKRFRTDILIEEQIKHIKQFEIELKTRQLTNKIIDLNDTNTTSFNYLSKINQDDFDDLTNINNHTRKSPRPISCNDLELNDELLTDNEHEEEVEKKEEEKQKDKEILINDLENDNKELIFQTNENLLKLYYRNLIRLNVVKKFNIELEFHRSKLSKAMRHQNHNLREIRSKVEWLENEIEKIILSNKNVSLYFLI
jgi:hypothetical protein